MSKSYKRLVKHSLYGKIEGGGSRVEKDVSENPGKQKA